MITCLGREDGVLQLPFWSDQAEKGRFPFLLQPLQICLTKRYSDERLPGEEEDLTPSEYPEYHKDTGNCWV